MERKLKHLEFIQDAITRMANNSFLLKGWSVTIVGALLALSVNESDNAFIAVSAVILLYFWLLDSFYLHKEKLFIEVYKLVAAKSVEDINFDMSFKQLESKGSIWRCAFSPSMVMFYGGVAVAHGVLCFLTNHS